MWIIAVEFSSGVRSVAACAIDPRNGEITRCGLAVEEATRSGRAIHLVEEALKAAGMEREEIDHLAGGTRPRILHRNSRGPGLRARMAAGPAGRPRRNLQRGPAGRARRRGESARQVECHHRRSSAASFYLAGVTSLTGAKRPRQEPLRIVTETEIRERAGRGEQFFGARSRPVRSRWTADVSPSQNPGGRGREKSRVRQCGKPRTNLFARDGIRQSAATESLLTAMKTYRCWAEIDLDALRAWNLGWLRRKVMRPKVRIMTVVKADAYGHGLKQIAALLMQSGTDVFGVANLAEAAAIRSVGKGWPVLMLGPCLPGEVETAVRDDVMPTLSSLEEGATFLRGRRPPPQNGGRAPQSGHRHGPIGLSAETGAGSGATNPGTPRPALGGPLHPFLLGGGRRRFYARTAKSVRRRSSQVRRRGLSHPHYPRRQQRRGVLLERRSHYDLVRPGLLVYGVVPPGIRTAALRKQPEVQPALTWKCRVGFVKEVPRWTPVSYGHTHSTTGPARLATLTVGYGDGYARRAGNRAMVLVRGQRCRVTGRVAMDQLMVDVSHVPEVAAGGRGGADWSARRGADHSHRIGGLV